MFEGGGRYGKFNGRLAVLSSQQGVNQSAAKAVSAAHPVHDAQVILLGEAVVFPIVQHAGPVVVAGGNGAAQGDGHPLKAELVSQLPGHTLVAFLI